MEWRSKSAAQTHRVFRNALAELLEPRVLLSASPIVSGQTIGATIGSPGQIDSYNFSAGAGNTIEISMADTSSTSTLVPALEVYGPDGKRVATGSALSTASPARILYRVPAGASGSYTISAHDRLGAGTGGYYLELGVVPGSQSPPTDGDGGPILSPQVLPGNISNPGDFDIYTFSAAAQSTFALTDTNADVTSLLNPEILVFGPDGAELAAPGASFNNTSVQVLYRVPSTGGGTYTVIAQDHSGDNTGGYNIALAIAPGTQAPTNDGDGGVLTLGQTTQGMISKPGDLDVYTFSIPAGQRFELMSTRPGVDLPLATDLLLFDSAGNQVGVTQSPGIVIYTPTLGAGETFTAVVRGASATGTGGYVLKLWPLIASPSIAVNDGATSDDTAAQTQRSEVRNIVLSFSAPVMLGQGSLTLAWNGSKLGETSEPADRALGVPQTPDGGLTWIVPIKPKTGFGDLTGSLIDGVYTLTADLSKVAGAFFDQKSFSMRFHRLFGDINGDRTVNNLDYLQFKSAFLSSKQGPGYNADFDYNADGHIDNADYQEFRKRYLNAFTY